MPLPPESAGRLRLLLLLAATSAPAAAATLQVEVQGNGNKPLADAVVYLESREARAAAKPASAEIAQVSRQFQPRVTILPVGTSVQFPNRDTVRHHVYSFSPAKTFELKLYIGTEAKPVVFDKPGVAVLGCNIHDNMAAWVVVVETPYYGTSGANGKVTLDNVPPGSYRLRFWHPGLPPDSQPQDQALTLAASGGSVAVRLPVAP